VIERLRIVIESSRFQNAIMAVIVINAIVIGMETSPLLTERFGVLLSAIDAIGSGFC